MDLIHQVFWKKYAEQLCDRSGFDIIDPEEEMICYLKDAVHIMMTNPEQKSSRFNLFSLGSIIPNWSPSYTQPDYLLGTYRVFMDYLRDFDYPDPDLPEKIRSAAYKFNTMHSVYWKLEAEYKRNWKKIKTESPMVSRDQYDKEYGSNYRKVTNVYKETTRRYVSLVNQKAYSEHLCMLKNFARISSFSGGACCKEGNNQLNYPHRYHPCGLNSSDRGIKELLQSGDKSSIMELFVPSYVIPEFDFIYNAWLEDIENERTSVDPIDICWPDWAERNNYSGSVKSVCSVKPGSFLSVISCDSQGRMSAKSTFEQENFNLKIHFFGLFSFFIKPSGWFNKGFCQDGNNTKWVFCSDLGADIPEILDSGMYGRNPRLFGENGSAITMPEKLIIGFEPIIELSLNAKDYAEIKSIYTSTECAIIVCGPFSTGAMPVPEPTDQDEIWFDDENSRIVIKLLTSDMPMLLGFICRKV